MDRQKKIAIFSNYSWAYLTTEVARKTFPNAEKILITANIEDVAKKHDFELMVVDAGSLNQGGAFSLFKASSFITDMSFDAAVIDYGFNLTIAYFILMLRFDDIYLVDFEACGSIRKINKLEFVKAFINKTPYFMNKILIHISKKLRMDLSLGQPSEISIETTTMCNLKCKACPTGLGQLNRPPMFIPASLFADITERNKRNFKYFDIIFPFIFGEPLLNKDIIVYLKGLRAISANHTRIEVHTNGNIRADSALVEELLTSGIDLINVSLDGTDGIAYESFRKGGNFDLVCEFVKSLSAAKKRLGILKPEIVIQMILTKYSECQKDEFKKLKTRLGADRLIFKGYFHEFTGLSDEEGYSLAPSKKELTLSPEEKKEIINKKNNVCGWAYRAISIMANGNVTPCCIDYNTTLLDGLSINDTTIRSLWNSGKYRKFRRDMLKGRIPICNKCFFS